MLAPWKKSYDQPRQHIKKKRHYFPNKAMAFPVVMYECKSWTIKKAKHQRTEAFEQQQCFQGLPRWLSGKESTCNAGRVGSIPV